MNKKVRMFSCHSAALPTLPRRSMIATAVTFALAAPAIHASAATLSVGPGKAYAMPCQALTRAAAGDVVEIDAAGSYAGDVCAFAVDNLTIRGVNGRPKIDAAGRYAAGKGTWVVQGKSNVIENVEMFGAKVPDRNGAAIRLDGIHLTLRGSYLHDNENGILTSNDGISDIVIENTEFSRNGYGDGYSHNLYVGHVNSLTFRYNYSHDANVGHNLKSRAKLNTITYNRFSSSGQGQPSYEIDLPNAGTSYVIGNVVQQPANNGNSNLLTYGTEGATNPGQDLYVVNNTFINDYSSGGNFILVGSTVTTPVLIQNNIFAGTGTMTNQTLATLKTNYQSLLPAFVDRANYDLRPASGAPFINAGSAPGTSASGVSLVPVNEYRHVASAQVRPVAGQLDIGAYEAAASVTTTTVVTGAPTTTTRASTTSTQASTTTTKAPTTTTQVTTTTSPAQSSTQATTTTSRASTTTTQAASTSTTKASTTTTRRSTTTTKAATTSTKASTTSTKASTTSTKAATTTTRASTTTTRAASTTTRAATTTTKASSTTTSSTTTSTAYTNPRPWWRWWR
ncbi:hypothetical protein EDC30_105179 [Paucimonas lemoignei]|uniref:Parallel beta helix pectate lyase-like protein n=1 Tax=Paucimonas lemoignei TaxID=29443 RepID=A0A4R3HUP9_PAULE|nr:hypothetical protein [Paucimonas lemoignei]TCS36957.1 hypothetical protein EDC30_105179 [Paucimonas lemoignei]